MSMTVSCPNCSSRYALPAHLLGPSGARVVCPACWHRFSLDSGGDIVPEEMGFPAPAVPAAPAAVWPAPVGADAHAAPAAVDEERSNADAALDALFGPFEIPGAAPIADPSPPAATIGPGAGPQAGTLEVAPARPPAAAAEAPPLDPHSRRDHLLAREALAGLEAVAGDVRGAAERGRLFSEFGPRLLEAFDRYRIAGGHDADAGTFRGAMRERLGVDLG